MKTSKNTTLVLSILLAIAGNFNAGAENVTYYIGGSGEGHYTNLGAAVTAAHTAGDTDVTFMLINDVTENDQIIQQEGDNFTIKSPVGERHVIQFSSTVNSKSSVYNLIYVKGGILNIGGDDSGVVILRAWEGATALTAPKSKVLIKVINESVLNIYKNTELAYGKHVVWLRREDSSKPLPIVNMYDGVMHSATNFAVDITEGYFNMYGGYICGHYFSEGATIPYDNGASGKNRILDYQNVVDYFSSYEVLPNSQVVKSFLQSCYNNTTLANNAAIFANKYDSYITMSGGVICGFYTDTIISGLVNNSTSASIEESSSGVSLNNGTFNFSGGKIYACCTGVGGTGAGICSAPKDFGRSNPAENYNHALINMSGNATIAYCQSTGAAVRLINGTTMNMSGGLITKSGEISASSSSSRSGGIRLVASFLKMSGTAKISYCSVYYNSGTNSEANSGGGIGAVHEPSYGKIPTAAEITGGEICYNYASRYGGGISITDRGQLNTAGIRFSLKGAKIYGNKCGMTGAGIFINGKTTVDISMNDSKEPVEVYNNESNLSGGGLYIDSTSGEKITVNISDCNIHNNSSITSTGGGMYAANAEVTVNDGTNIYANIIGQNGAGVYLGPKSNYTQNGGNIYSNTTDSSGGGLYVSDGTVTINGGEITGNTAHVSGGGIYAAKGNVTIENATIGKNGAANTAETGNGGAIYVAAGNLGITDTQITGNIATAQDGGAFYVSGGTVTLSGENNFISNHAGRNGGSLCLAGGSLNVSEGSSFTENTAQNGAGAYVGGGGLTMTGGVFAENTASRNGGGAYVSGGTVTFNGNIHDNNAANGAGLYLASGAQMTYTGGIMSANNAKVSGQAISNTAYYGRTGALPIEGCGGGIYLENGPSSSKKTSLKFQFPEGEQTFGLYGNTADKAGQEILAEGHYTDITLPAIANMKLAGFEGQDANPNWYQDYFTDDDEYGDNVDEYTGDHHAVTNKVSHIDRYKNIMSRYGGEFVQHLIPDETLGNIKNKYLAITLGFSMLDLTVTANGLLGGETALVKLIRYGSSGQKTYDVMLKKGENETTASKTLLNMPWGTYSIIPNNSWNWHYEPINPMTNIRIGDAAQYEIVLDYNHRSVAEQPLHYDVHD